MEKLVDLLRRLLNRLFYLFVGGDRRPVFFDVRATCPELEIIDANYAVIRAELMSILPLSAAIPRYHEVDEAQVGISAADERGWRAFFVHLFGRNEELPNRDLCPRTAAIVEGIPGVLQAFFSILEPGKSVPSHNGPYLGYLRHHTAFVVPPSDPPTIRIKDRYHTWREGESVLFDDSWDHEVFNRSTGVRVVLIVDVLRPMAWPLALLNRLARRVFFSRPMTRAALENIPPIRRAG